MPFLKRFFGMGAAGAAADVAPATITVFDNDGRPIEISREEWRSKILPGRFRERWDNPDELANAISEALHDQFVAEALEPARRLHQIDPQVRRSAAILAATLLQLKRYADAEHVLAAALKKHGEDGYLLTNLAKAHAGKGDQARAERTLWRALEIDPNQDNGLMWYAVMQRERGGDAAERQAFAKVANLPGSWRAQGWLARTSLGENDVAAALAWYREAFSRVNPAPADLLMQASGDLGSHGRLSELVELCTPRFDARLHGLAVGNNLIKAYLELGDADEARAVLDKLYAQQRPDWRDALAYWDGELDKPLTIH
jgi:tetratricopeptide (TPR) repeat protein